MALSVFEFDEYKPYLDARLRSVEQRGYRSQFAEKIGCQPSYLSQVLNGKPELTLEQAHRASRELLHDRVESKYFMLLVEMSRAGTRELRAFFAEQLEEIRVSRFDLKKRLKATDDVPLEAKHRYYSTWFYSAIHILLAVPGYSEPHKIATRLHLPVDVVSDVLHFLEEIGLIELVDGAYVFTKVSLHLDRNSEFIQRHHINWRSQSLSSAEKNLKNDLHFSTVFALTRTDFEKVKDVFVQAIENARAVIRPSASEELCAITLDVFEV